MRGLLLFLVYGRHKQKVQAQAESAGLLYVFLIQSVSQSASQRSACVIIILIGPCPFPGTESLCFKYHCCPHLLGDLLSGRDEGRGPALAGVVRLDDGLAVADAVVRHQGRHRVQSVT